MRERDDRQRDAGEPQRRRGTLAQQVARDAVALPEARKARVHIRSVDMCDSGAQEWQQTTGQETRT